MISSLLLLLASCLSVALCGYPGKENATMIRLNTLESLSTTSSPAYFKFVLTSVSFVNVVAKPAKSDNSASLQMDLIDAAETFFGSAGTPAGAELSALLLSGTYFLYMPNAVAGFTLSVNTTVCGENGVAAPAANNRDPQSAVDVLATRSEPLPVWFCPPSAPQDLFFRLKAPQPGTVRVSMSTTQQLAPIFGSTLRLLAADGTTVLSTCGQPVDFSTQSSCSWLLNKTDDFVFVKVTRAASIAGGRVQLQFDFDSCTPDQWEPNGLPPATPVDELGTVFVGATLCRGDHDFYQLPTSAGAKVVGARIDGDAADYLIRIIQRKNDAVAYTDSTLAISEPANNATQVAAWVLLPDDATQVYFEVQLSTAREDTPTPRYNLSVAIGYAYVIDVTTLDGPDNETTTTTTTALPGNVTFTTTPPYPGTTAPPANVTAPTTAPPANVTAPLTGTTPPAANVTAPNGTRATKKKRAIDQTEFTASKTVTRADQVQKILNDIGDIVPVVQGVTATSLGLLLPAPNAGKVAQVEAQLKAKLAEARTVARFAELNMKLGATRAVEVGGASPAPGETTASDTSIAATTQLTVTVATVAAAIAMIQN